jgi:hypothetical protein
MNPLLDLFVSTDIDVNDKKVRDFVVSNSTLVEVREFIEHWHYSSTVKGMTWDYVFKMVYEGQIIGAMIYGKPAMHNQWMKYVDNEDELLELRRLCCIDNTPKNTESYFIGKTLKWLKKNTGVRRIVSYADPFYEHSGTIYKASNFKHVGMSPGGKKILLDGKYYHDKCIRDYDKPRFKRTGEKVLIATAVRLREALKSGEAQWVQTPGKHIYIYDLKS